MQGDPVRDVIDPATGAKISVNIYTLTRETTGDSDRLFTPPFEAISVGKKRSGWRQVVDNGSGYGRVATLTDHVCHLFDTALTKVHTP